MTITFMVEMCELRQILKRLIKKVYLGDELCSGTEIDSATIYLLQD